MDCTTFFKTYFQDSFPTDVSKASIQAAYDKQLDAFISQAKEENPDIRLWIHAYRDKGFFFLKNGETISISVTLVRLKIANGPYKGSTFTFYGDLFFAGSKYSRQFVMACLWPVDNVWAEVSCRTLTRWRKACRIHCEEACSRLSQSCGTSPSERFIHLSVIFLLERHRVPFWHLS